MRLKPRRQRRRFGFFLFLTVVAVILVLWRPARQPIAETIDYLGDLGYHCTKEAEAESIHLCADKAGGDPSDPQTKTTLWLYSPFEVGEVEVLADTYCEDPNLKALIDAGFIPTAWEFDRQVVVWPHELYGQESVRDQYPSRKAWLDTNLKQIPTFSLEIPLDTRCIWYVAEPAGGGLV